MASKPRIATLLCKINKQINEFQNYTRCSQQLLRTGVEKSNNTKRSKVTNESSCLLLTIGNRNLQTNYFLPNYKVLTISIIF